MRARCGGHFGGTSPSLSSLGPLWVIARCHWVKLISENRLHPFCCVFSLSLSAGANSFPGVVIEL